jgi:hypothetical protein
VAPEAMAKAIASGMATMPTTRPGNDVRSEVRARQQAGAPGFEKCDHRPAFCNPDRRLAHTEWPVWTAWNSRLDAQRRRAIFGGRGRRQATCTECSAPFADEIDDIAARLLRRRRRWSSA